MTNRAKKSKKHASAVANAGPPFCTRLNRNCRNTMFRTMLMTMDMEATMTGVFVSRALLYYAIGLPALASVKLIVPAFYSARDTKTPVIVASISMVINIVLNIVFLQFLFKRVQNGGPALATALACFFDFFALFVIFRLRYGALGTINIL